MKSYLMVLVLLTMVMDRGASAQISSLGARERSQGQNPPPTSREAPLPQTNPTYETHSWIAFGKPPLRAYRIHDLLTVIVRQQRQFEVEADLKTQKKWDIRSQLEAFFKPAAGGLGSAGFRRGKPNIDYSFNNKLDTKADTSREDKLTTRISVKIIDVKPNGLLVLEGRGRIQHDDEVSTITLTGTCRKDDITPDNTVLSTQVADLDIAISNEGAVRANSSRGWIPKLIDWIKPI
ncbi:MAG: flagellar basal body L-ring protein FlgH [Planctomycetota bacterium]